MARISTSSQISTFNSGMDKHCKDRLAAPFSRVTPQTRVILYGSARTCQIDALKNPKRLSKTHQMSTASLPNGLHRRWWPEHHCTTFIPRLKTFLILWHLKTRRTYGVFSGPKLLSKRYVVNRSIQEGSALFQCWRVLHENLST